MNCVVVQARLDSTRLPKKALLDLRGKPVILRVMENLRRIHADIHVLACDEASEHALAPFAEAAGFRCIAGPKEDVLERFCLVVRKTGADTILRATGDNPFLLIDAAQQSLVRFHALAQNGAGVDYFTYAGLPHGCGVEVLSARALLKAAVLTQSTYEHEHVGPALYNHPDSFRVAREQAPSVWYRPEMRTTIDTRDDYERALLAADYLGRNASGLPASTAEVFAAFDYVDRTVLLVPSLREGRGTGHLRRLVDLAIALRERRRCLLYVPASSPAWVGPLIPAELHDAIVDELPCRAHLVVLDRFRTSPSEMAAFRSIGPVLALDEGGKGAVDADYLLDVLPRPAGVQVNESDPGLLALPLARRSGDRRFHWPGTPGSTKVLVALGGEDAVGYTVSAARSLAVLGYRVTALVPSGIDSSVLRADGAPPVEELHAPVPGLRERLAEFDLVVTHYGFTAFESLAAGTRVLLLSPTAYHLKLARSYGFASLPVGVPSAEAFAVALATAPAVPDASFAEGQARVLGDRVDRLAGRASLACPLCQSRHREPKPFRFVDRTVSRCASCGMLYLSFSAHEAPRYGSEYFFEEYRRQYGKTYLEDFESIRAQGARRVAIIDRIASQTRIVGHGEERRLVDVGCAYGPFLAAARDAGWSPVGTDVSVDAVSYVNNTLEIPAAVSSFPAPDREGLLDSRRFHALTLWFVIEHFEDLEGVLNRAREMLVPGGILAFSTPSARGVSARKGLRSFLRASPNDHYTIWDPARVRRQLARYGFSVRRVISTGHHPERFPLSAKLGSGHSLSRVLRPLNAALSRLFSLGDTFEVYAIKRGTMKDVE